MGMRCELRKSKRDYADMQDLRNYTRVRRDIDVDFEGQLELLERIRLWIRGMTCSTAHPSPTPGNQLATLDVSDSLQAESKHVQMRKTDSATPSSPLLSSSILQPERQRLSAGNPSFISYSCFNPTKQQLTKEISLENRLRSCTCICTRKCNR